MSPLSAVKMCEFEGLNIRAFLEMSCHEWLRMHVYHSNYEKFCRVDDFFFRYLMFFKHRV